MSRDGRARRSYRKSGHATVVHFLKIPLIGPFMAQWKLAASGQWRHQHYSL
jgi:hypothetical protein